MAPPPNDDHECGWKVFATELGQEMATMRAELDALKRRVLGPKSEKLPPMDREVRKQRPADPAATQEKRRKNAELRAARVETETIEHKVPDADRVCPKCNGTKLRSVGLGKESIVVDYVPGYFRRRRHVRETLACPCGQHMVVAPGPDHSVEGARYGDGFRAFVVTSKCADSIPLYRQARQLSRLGVPISRSTLTNLLHQVARPLEPLADRHLKLVAGAEIVQADETSLKMQKPNLRGFVWTFLADKLIAYKFAGNRSGDTPEAVLGTTSGTLVVDMFTGYNVVTGTGKSDRIDPRRLRRRARRDRGRRRGHRRAPADATGANRPQHGPADDLARGAEAFAPAQGTDGLRRRIRAQSLDRVDPLYRKPGHPARQQPERVGPASRRPRPEDFSIRWAPAGRPEPRWPVLPRRHLHGLRQRSARLPDGHPWAYRLAPGRPSRRSATPKLVLAGLTVVPSRAILAPRTCSAITS